MARDVMTIRLQLRRIRVVDVLVDTISQPWWWRSSRPGRCRVVGGVGSRPGWCMMCDLGGFATEGSGIGR